MKDIENICPRCCKTIPSIDIKTGMHDCGLTFDPKDFEHFDIKCLTCEEDTEIRTIPEIFVPMHGTTFYCSNCQQNQFESISSEESLGLNEMDEEDAESALSHPF